MDDLCSTCNLPEGPAHECPESFEDMVSALRDRVEELEWEVKTARKMQSQASRQVNNLASMLEDEIKEQRIAHSCGFWVGCIVGIAIVNWAEAIRNNHLYNPTDFCAGCRVVWAEPEKRHADGCIWGPST